MKRRISISVLFGFKTEGNKVVSTGWNQDGDLITIRDVLSKMGVTVEVTERENGHYEMANVRISMRLVSALINGVIGKSMQRVGSYRPIGM